MTSDPIDRIVGAGHTVETSAIGRELVTWLEHETAGKGWEAFILLANGDVHHRQSPFQPGQTRRPGEETREWMRRLVIRLNREVPHNGAWIVAYGGDSKLFCLWKDQTGVVRVVADEEDSWVRMRATPMDRFVANADICVRKYVWGALQELGITPSPKTILTMPGMPT